MSTTFATDWPSHNQYPVFLGTIYECIEVRLPTFELGLNTGTCILSSVLTMLLSVKSCLKKWKTTWAFSDGPPEVFQVSFCATISKTTFTFRHFGQRQEWVIPLAFRELENFSCMSFYSDNSLIGFMQWMDYPNTSQTLACETDAWT